jgi:carbon storage regulator
MLVLSRKKDEVIVVGDDIEITVVDIRGDQVKIGVAAPRSVSIHRKEVYDAIKRENLEASKSSLFEVGGLAAALRKRLEQAKPPTKE